MQILSVNDYVHTMIFNGKSKEEVSKGILATFSFEEIYNASSIAIKFDKE